MRMWVVNAGVIHFIFKFGNHFSNQRWVLCSGIESVDEFYFLLHIFKVIQNFTTNISNFINALPSPSDFKQGNGRVVKCSALF